MATTSKAVYLEDIDRVRDVVELLERTYPGPEWTGALVFLDSQGGLVLVACFDLEHYRGNLPLWESLFPARDLRVLSLREVCANGHRYRLLLADGAEAILAHLKLVP